MPNAATLTPGVAAGSDTRVAPGFLAVVRRELRRFFHRRTYPLLALVLPLVGWLLLRSVFGAHVARDLPVVIIDQDHSLLSRRIARAIDATSAVRVVDSRDGGDDVERILRRGEAYAVVVISEGEQRSIARGDRSPVLLFTNGQWMLPASLIARDVRTAVATLSGELDVRNRVARGDALPRARIAAEPIRGELHPLYNPALDYAAFLFLALIPTLLHVFVLSLAVQCVGSELKGASTTEWLAASDGSWGVALAGKMLPYTLWFTSLGIVLLEGAMRSLDLPMAGSRALLYAGIALLVLAYQGLALFLVAMTSNFRLSSSLAAFLAGPAFAVAGVSFPRFAMPAVAQWWSAALPLTHYLQLQTGEIIAGAPAANSLPSLGVLAVFTIAVVSLALARLPRLLREPRYWGRI